MIDNYTKIFILEDLLDNKLDGVLHNYCYLLSKEYKTSFSPLPLLESTVYLQILFENL